MTLPLSAREPHRFNPLTDALDKARDALDAARRRHDEIDALDGAERFEKILDALVDLDAATKALKAAEENVATYGAKVPTLLLRVRTYRDNGAWQKAIGALRAYPNDSAALKALRDAADTGAFDAEMTAEVKRLAAAARTHGTIANTPLAAEMTRLLNAALEQDAPYVRAIIDRRVDWNRQYQELAIRFHLVGWEGAGMPEFPPRDPDGLAGIDVMDAIPPVFHKAVADKAEELAGLGKLARGSSAAP